MQYVVVIMNAFLKVQFDWGLASALGRIELTLLKELISVDGRIELTLLMGEWSQFQINGSLARRAIKSKSWWLRDDHDGLCSCKPADLHCNHRQLSDLIVKFNTLPSVPSVPCVHFLPLLITYIRLCYYCCETYVHSCVCLNTNKRIS